MNKNTAFADHLKMMLENWEQKKLIDPKTRRALEQDIDQNNESLVSKHRSWLSFRMCMLLLAGLFIVLVFFTFFFSDLYHWIDQHILGESDFTRSIALLVMSLVFYYFCIRKQARSILSEILSLFSALSLAGGLIILIINHLPSIEALSYLNTDSEKPFFYCSCVVFLISFLPIVHRNSIAYNTLFICSAVAIWNTTSNLYDSHYPAFIIPFGLGCIIHFLSLMARAFKPRMQIIYLETTAFVFCFGSFAEQLTPIPFWEHFPWFISSYSIAGLYAFLGRWYRKNAWIWFGVAASLYTSTLLLYAIFYPMSLLLYLLIMAALFTTLGWYSERIIIRLKV